MSDDSIRGLATTIAALKDQAGQLRTAVAAVKGHDRLHQEQLTAAGVEGGPAARLSGCSAGHERAATQLEAIEGRLERARFIAMSAINGLYGSGTLTRSGDQADDPTSWDKPHKRNGADKASKAREAFWHNEGCHGPGLDGFGESFGNSLGRAADAFRREFGPPMEGTQSEAQVSPAPKAQVGKQPVGHGNAAMAIVALVVVAAKGQQSLSSAINRWTGKKREQDK